MNKLTKVGCSALCGSLAGIVSANAGSLTATGGADLTYVSVGNEVTGNPMGMGSNINFKGSGELDNGWTFDLTIAQANGKVFSAANITLDMQGLGKLNFNQGNSGNGIAAFDDKMPTAWEEAWGAGISTGVKLVLGSGASDNVMYTTPTLLGTTITLTRAFEYGTSDTNDKVNTAGSDEKGSSYDATININPSLGTEVLAGLNIFAGGSTVEIYDNSTLTEEDAYEAVGGVTFDLGPLSIGAQMSGLYSGEESDSTVYHTYKNSAYGIAFNVNDDLSLSYGQYISRKVGYHDSGAQRAGSRVEVSSFQAAYTMGGASVRLANSTSDNNKFVAGTSVNATTISLGLAF